MPHFKIFLSLLALLPFIHRTHSTSVLTHDSTTSSASTTIHRPEAPSALLSHLTAHTSTDTSSTRSKTVRIPTASQRKRPFKPRTRERYLTGTAREQVEQFRYLPVSRRPDETEAQFQGRTEKKMTQLQYRKAFHMNKIIKWEKELNGDVAAVTKRYNEWMQSVYDKKNLNRTKMALDKSDLKQEGYIQIRLEKEKQDEEIPEDEKLSNKVQRTAQHKTLIRQQLKSGDEHLIMLAKKRMERHGITDLTDGRIMGARKAAVRRRLLKNPNHEGALEEAQKLGMDTTVMPMYKKKELDQEWDQSKRLKMAAPQDSIASPDSMHHQESQTIEGQGKNHHLGISNNDDRQQSKSSAQPDTSPVQKAALSFDLNVVPFQQDE